MVPGESVSRAPLHVTVFPRPDSVRLGGSAALSIDREEVRENKMALMTSQWTNAGPERRRYGPGTLSACARNDNTEFHMLASVCFDLNPWCLTSHQRAFSLSFFGSLGYKVGLLVRTIWFHSQQGK